MIFSLPNDGAAPPAGAAQATASPDGPIGASSELIACREVRKSFSNRNAGGTLEWHLPELTVAQGERVIVTGPSGCGKTTLVNLLSGLLRPDAGVIVVDGIRVDQLSTAQADIFRGSRIGLVVQSFQLLRPLSALDNVLLGARYGRRWRGAEARERAEALLAQVGLADRRFCPAGQLSIGEQQRVAVARALINEPPLLLADEPTANLDARNAEAVLDLLLGLSARHGATLLVVSHDAALAPHFHRCLDASGWISSDVEETAHV